jgi:hypothetical protein
MPVHTQRPRMTAGRAATPTATIRAWNSRKEPLFTEHHVVSQLSA